MCFTFCGFNLMHFVHVNAVAVVAHVPWLLWAADKLVRSTKRSERLFLTAMIGTLTASQLLVGYPQYVFLSVVAELLVLAVIYWRREATWSPMGVAVLVDSWQTARTCGRRRTSAADDRGAGGFRTIGCRQRIRRLGVAASTECSAVDRTVHISIAQLWDRTRMS